VKHYALKRKWENIENLPSHFLAFILFCVYIPWDVRSIVKKEKHMSLEELMKPQDMPVRVGVMSKGGLCAPVYMVDFGKEYPPMHTMVRRYKKIILDTQPSPNGFMYYVTSDKVVTEITSKDLDRALAAPPEQMLFELTRNGTPEFSSCFEVSHETDTSFRAARNAFQGCWVLILLAQEATEVFLDAEDMVLMVTPQKRESYLR
jgi:hypothetical protein